jgi:hypothetical protein
LGAGASADRRRGGEILTADLTRRLPPAGQRSDHKERRLVPYYQFLIPPGGRTLELKAEVAAAFTRAQHLVLGAAEPAVASLPEPIATTCSRSL